MTSVLRIAIADDEPLVREYFCKILASIGHDVVAVASNGVELIECCRRELPDMIIADVRMPEMDGDEAIRRISPQMTIPFILISAFGKPTTFPSGVGAVPWTYLTKPINRVDLERAICELCRQCDS